MVCKIDDNLHNQAKQIVLEQIVPLLTNRIRLEILTPFYKIETQKTLQIQKERLQQHLAVCFIYVLFGVDLY